MKNSKNTFVSILLFLTVSLYLGQAIIDSICHIKSKVEIVSSSSDSQRLVSSESSLEEDVPIDFPSISVQIINSGCESFTSNTCFFPTKLYYSIWLPPDIS